MYHNFFTNKTMIQGNVMDIAYLLGAIIGSLISGALVGLIPLFLGKKFNKVKLGQIGFAGCLLGSFLAGLLLSIPICIIFSAIIIISDNTNISNLFKK